MRTEWKLASADATVFEGRDRKSGELKWTGTRVDLVSVPTRSCGPLPRSTPPPTRRRRSRTIPVVAWAKAMNLDRFDSR